MRELWVTIFVIAFFLSILLLVWGIAKPSGLPAFLQKLVKSRKKALQVFGTSTVAAFLLIGVVSPSQDRANISAQSTAAKSVLATTHSDNSLKSKDTVEVKSVSQTKAVAYSTVSQNDSSLPVGQTKIAQEGKDGVETLTYSVTYTNGKETQRVLTSDIVTTQPTTKIVANGTYVAPQPTATATSCGSDYYVNSDGVCVHSPSTNPSGATARCVDGTYSYSLHRSGTCSHHGGVAEWL